MSETPMQELKAAFVMLDKNGDGKVNAIEIKEMLTNLRICLPDNVLSHLIEQASKRGDGLIDESEFFAWMSSFQEEMTDDLTKDLMAAFGVFDRDENGYITREELKSAMELIDESMSEEQLDELLSLMDVDCDGKINYEDFLRILM